MNYNIITIEREYASGGTEIGTCLAESLGISYFGPEILQAVAGNMGTTPEQLMHLEETANSSLLFSVAMAAKMVSGQGDGLSRENELYMAEARVIWEKVSEGPCVIVGRCASWVLHEKKDVLSVYIHADNAFRRERAVSEYGIEASKCEAFLKKSDKRRSNYYSSATGKKWDDKTGYHLILDSSKLGIRKCVETIKAAVI